MPSFTSMRVATYAGMTDMPAHAHDAAILCLPLRGSYVERTRGRETEHRRGDLLLCPAGEAHSQLFPSGRVSKLLLTLSAETIDFLAGFVPVADAPYGRFHGLDALAMRLAGEVDEADPQSPLIADGLVQQVVGLFARETQRGGAAPEWLKSARDFVRASARSVVRLDEVAAFVQRRPAHLAAAYRQAFGCTIGEDARALRLERAARLLASTSEPIAGIAAECGFYDQPHLSRQFRRAYGMTPLAYRRRLH